MKHYIQYFEEVSRRKWNEPGLSDYQGETFTYAQVASEIGKLHTAYRRLGIKPGDKIAVCARNCARWAIAFLSTSSYKGVVVPLLYDFTPDAITRLTKHSESQILFTDSHIASGMKPGEADGLKLIINVDDYSCIWARKPEYAAMLEEAKAEYAAMYPDGIGKDEFHYEATDPEDLAVINYTSGTTGDPKGVMLPARSLSANVNYAMENVPVTDADSSLSMLPMAHMFGMTFEFLYPFCGGSHVYFLGKAPTPSALMQAFAEVKPYILITVPLVMEKIVKGKVLPALNKPAMKVMTAIPGLRNVVYNKVNASLMTAFGGRVRYIPMGGAALNPKVEDVLNKARIPYSVGYGMTECGPLISYEPWQTFKKGSCGRDLGKYGSVRIASSDPYREVGEVQVKGPTVMLGYYKNDSATKASFTEDGWLKTGDLGVLGRDGSIYLRGRSKCMILSGNGQNIYPEEIEFIVNNLPEVEESLVISREGKLVAMVSLKPEADKAAFEANLDKVNRELPVYSKLSRFEIMTEPFVHTPKHSIKRSVYTDLNNR